MTNLSDLAVIPLRNAVFCVGCQILCNESGELCPVCKFPSLFSLAQIIDRLPDEEPEPEVVRALECLAN